MGVEAVEPAVAPPSGVFSSTARRAPEVPAAWRRFVTAQRHEDYSTADHATWRRLVADTESLIRTHEAKLHPDYVRGFRRLVLPWQEIPTLRQINDVLAELGWRSVCVDGYIPAEVYSGLMADGIFPVSRQIRRPEHIEFSPSPDIAHDLIGHIPMLVSAEHRSFLRRLSRAIAETRAQPADRQLYLANRELGLLRGEQPHQHELLAAAATRVAAAQRTLTGAPTLLARLERLYLWSIEFGLLGTLDAHHIYGAGLLSSPAESAALCASGARLQEFSAFVSERPIDFSEHQSAYFVARDHDQLEQALSALLSDAARLELR